MSLPSVTRSFFHVLEMRCYEFPQGVLFVLCDPMRYVVPFCLAAHLLGFLLREVHGLTRINPC